MILRMHQSADTHSLRVMTLTGVEIAEVQDQLERDLH